MEEAFASERADEMTLEHRMRAGIERDALNVWNRMLHPQMHNALQPLPHYGQFLQTKYGPEEAARILSDSDAAAVAAFDALADEFNHALPQLRQTVDPHALAQFEARINELFKNTRFVKRIST